MGELPRTHLLTSNPVSALYSRLSLQLIMAAPNPNPDTPVTDPDQEDQDVVGPSRRLASAAGHSNSTADLFEELDSALPTNPEAVKIAKEHIKEVFQPMEDASMNSAKPTLEMSDDDSYSILSKCKIGSAVMLPFVLDPQWKA